MMMACHSHLHASVRDFCSIVEQWKKNWVPKVLKQVELECGIRPSLAVIQAEIQLNGNY